MSAPHDRVSTPLQMSHVSNTVKRMIREAGNCAQEPGGNSFVMLHSRAASQMRSYIAMTRVKMQALPSVKSDANVLHLLQLVHKVEEHRKHQDRSEIFDV